MKPIAFPVGNRPGAASGDPQQPGYVVSDGVSDLALSPDAHTLALTSFPDPKTNEVYLARVAAADGSGYRKLYGPFRSDKLGNKIAWTADSRTILFAMSDSNDRWKIMRIPAGGGNAEFTGLEVDRLRNFDLSSDGSRIAFEVGADTNWEVRALDYVSSITKTGR
jgi:Tol biopolymer transport system component